MSVPDPGREGRRLGLLAAVLIVLVALAARFSTFRQVFTPLGLIFPETDPFYHARRILLALQHFPRVIQFDSYVNFPEGARIIWPVGFDLAMAVLGAAAGGLQDLDGGIRAVAISIPFLALLGIGLTGLLARRIAGTRAGFCAAALVAISPQQVAYGLIGRIDHNVLEPLWFAGAWLAFLRAAEAGDRRAGDRWALLSGALMALAFWFITTATLIPSFLAAAIAIASVIRAVAPGKAPGLSRPAAIAFGAAALLLLPLVLGSSFGQAGEFSYLGLSWFHEAAVILTGLGVAAVHWVLGGHPVKRLVIILAGAAVAATGVFFAGLPEGRGVVETAAALRDAGAFLFRVDPVVVTVLESRSPLSMPPMQMLWQFTPWIWFAPLAWAGLAVVCTRERFASVARTLLLAIFPFAYALFLVQLRFGLLLGVPLAVLAGWATDGAWRAARAGDRRPVVMATLLVAIATLPAAAWALRPGELENLRGTPDPMVRALLWMRGHTPPTRGFDDPRVKPEYGVLCTWDQGHALTWFARRPNVANPFGQTPWHIRGAVRAARIYIEADPASAELVCEALSIRYLVLQSTRGEILSVATVAKGKRNPFASEDKDAQGATVTRVLPPYFETLHARLALFDGASIPSDNTMLPALPGFRLVYESPEAGEFPVFARGAREPIVPRLVKVFERVRGAELEGSCRAGEPVAVSAEVLTNTGRRFAYKDATPCGGAGRFALRVPYARSISGDTGAVGAYLLRNGAREASALVTESDVEEGRRIAVAGWGS